MLNRIKKFIEWPMCFKALIKTAVRDASFVAEFFKSKALSVDFHVADIPLFAYRSIDFIRRPFVSIHSLTQGIKSNTGSIAQFAQRYSEAIPNYESRISPISYLFRSCRPSTIIRRIGTVIVSSVKGFPGWASTHITQKCSEIIPPLLANGDTSAAVIFIWNCIFVIAPLFHVQPKFKFFGFTESVGSSAFTKLLFSVASATNSISAIQTRDSYRCFCSAITVAKPIAFIPSASAMRKTKSSQSSIFLASDIGWKGHRLLTYLITIIISLAIISGNSQGQDFIDPRVLPPEATLDAEIIPTGTANEVCITGTPGPTFTVALCSAVDLSGKTVTLPSNVVGNAQMSDNAVNTAEIVDNAVTAAKVNKSGAFDWTGRQNAGADFRLSGLITPTALSGAGTNNYNPTGLSTAVVVRIEASEAHLLTGLAGGASGRLIALYNIGATFTITLVAESTASTDVNRFGLNSNLALEPGHSVLLQYVSNRWRVLGSSTGSSGGGSPTTAQYLLGAADGLLPNGRVCTDTATIDCDMGTAVQAKFNVQADSIGAAQIKEDDDYALTGQVSFTKTIKGKTSSGAPGAASCDEAGYDAVDTINSIPHFCRAQNENPISFADLGDAHHGGNDGTNSFSASGGEDIYYGRAGSLATEVEVFNGTAGGFTNQPANDAVECVSSSIFDTTQGCIIYGTTNGGDQSDLVVESVALNGDTAVATVKTDWGSIKAVRLSGTTTGNVTVREASAAQTITTIQAGNLRAANLDSVITKGSGTISNTVKSQVLQLSTDGTLCTDPAYRQINSGWRGPTIICADNDGSTIYGLGQVPDSWAGGTFTFELQYIQTAVDTGALNADISAACRGAGDTMNNTWGTEVAVDDAAVTGSSGLDHTTSAAVTPNGPCVAGDTLFVRLQIDAAGTTTAVATLHFLAIKGEYTVVGAGSD